MISKEDVLFWNEIEIDLFEERSHMFGVEFDLFNNQKSYHCKIRTVDNKEYYEYLHGDIYSAIDQYNAILSKE